MNTRIASRMVFASLPLVLLAACGKQEQVREIDWARAALARNPALEIISTDEASGTWENAFRTCDAIRTGGSTCNFVLQPGEGHTTDLNPASYWWTSQLGPFIWNELRLG